MTVKEFYEWAVANGVENFEFTERQHDNYNHRNLDFEIMGCIKIDADNKVVYVDNTEWEC